MKTAVFGARELTTAAEILKYGGLAAVPTETVYGLAANGFDPAAVEKLYEVKGRPPQKPINLLIPDMSATEKLCVDIPRQAYLLAERFWPGPRTMILKRSCLVPDIVKTCIANSDGLFIFDLCHIKMFDYWSSFQTGIGAYLKTVNNQ